MGRLFAIWCQGFRLELAAWEMFMRLFLEFMSRNTWAAIVFSSAIAVVVGWVTINTQRGINRRRATVDLLNSKMWDKDYLDAAKVFYDVMKDQKKLMNYYDLFTEYRKIINDGREGIADNDSGQKMGEAVDTILKIRAVLNDRELIAIGIREGSYDEAIYRRWWYTTLLQEWRLSVAFIARIRTDPLTGASPNAYAEFEALASRWQVEGPWPRRVRHFRVGSRVYTISRSR